MKKIIHLFIVLSICLIFLPQAWATLDEGLLGYWPFNGNANDESGNGNHGTVHGATLAEDRFGDANSAYSFDGVDDIINFGSPQALDDVIDGVHDFTFSAWYILEDISTFRTLFTKGNIGEGLDYSGAFAWTYDTYHEGYVFAICDPTEPAFDDPVLLKEWSTSDFPLNNWVHFALVYVSNSHEVEVYINGQKIAGSYIYNKYDGSIIENILDKDFKIGGEFIVVPGESNWKGLIDDICIYDRVLSGDDILMLYRIQNPWDDVIEVLIDIKPGSYPNSINLKSKGKIPVAILTTDDFDAQDVDPETCVFSGANPLRWNTEDVDYDGDYDMLLHFKTQELYLARDSTDATLEGETYDGMQILGKDSVQIVPNSVGKERHGRKNKKHDKKFKKGK